MLKQILEYFKHASTWKGIIGLVTAAGVNIMPEQAEAIIGFGLAGVGVIQVFIDDYSKDKSK